MTSKSPRQNVMKRKGVLKLKTKRPVAGPGSRQGEQTKKNKASAAGSTATNPRKREQQPQKKHTNHNERASNRSACPASPASRTSTVAKKQRVGGKRTSHVGKLGAAGSRKNRTSTSSGNKKEKQKQKQNNEGKQEKSQNTEEEEQPKDETEITQDPQNEAVQDCEDFARQLLSKGSKLEMADVTRAIQLARVPMQTRPNVVPKGERAVQGMVLGLYIYADRVGVTNCSARFPSLTKLLTKFGRQNVPESFVFTSIQVNVDYATRAHVDRNNLGRSQIIGLGDYSGGELWLHDDEGSVEETLDEDITQEPLYKKGTLWRGTNVDIHGKWFEFNGNRLHCTRPFQGSRLSLVYYTCDRYALAAQPVRAKLRTLGFDFSWGSAALKQLLEEKKRERAAQAKFFCEKAALGRRFGLLLQDGDQVAWQQENPKQENCKAHERYNNYRKARTIGAARKLGCQTIDLQYDFNWGYLQVTGLDPNPLNWDFEVLDPSHPTAEASNGRATAAPRRPKNQPGVRLRAAELTEWRTGFEVDPTVAEQLFDKCPLLRALQEQNAEDKDSRTGPTASVPLRILRSLLCWARTGRFRLKWSDVEETIDILTSWGAFSSTEVLIEQMPRASMMNEGMEIDEAEEGEEAKDGGSDAEIEAEDEAVAAASSDIPAAPGAS